MENELVCIVIPEPEYSVKQAIALNIIPPSTVNPGPIQPGQPLPAILDVLSKDPKFKKLVFDDLLKVCLVSLIFKLGKEAKIAGFEFPKALHLEGVNLMTIENGLLTVLS